MTGRQKIAVACAVPMCVPRTPEPEPVIEAVSVDLSDEALQQIAELFVERGY